MRKRGQPEQLGTGHLACWIAEDRKSGRSEDRMIKRILREIS